VHVCKIHTDLFVFLQNLATAQRERDEAIFAKSNTELHSAQELASLRSELDKLDALHEQAVNELNEVVAAADTERNAHDAEMIEARAQKERLDSAIKQLMQADGERDQEWQLQRTQFSDAIAHISNERNGKDEQLRRENENLSTLVQDGSTQINNLQAQLLAQSKALDRARADASEAQSSFNQVSQERDAARKELDKLAASELHRAEQHLASENALRNNELQVRRTFIPT
jgi:chromosome segregation ATPase